MILGVTGGIGAGKSLVCEIFSHLGIACYNSDERAKVLMNSNVELINGITRLLGSEAYIKHKLNRAYVAKKVFGNEQLLAEMNALVHPHVKIDFGEWVADQDSKYMIKEAAILIESGAYKQCDSVLVVSAPEELRISRVVNRDGTNRDAVVSRIRNQISEKERLSHANYIVLNDEKQMLVPQVIEVHEHILNQIEFNEL